MSDSEEIALVQRAQAGDRSAAEQLIERHDAFLRMMSEKWSTRFGHDSGDCYQQAVLGTLTALQRFDCDRGFKFLTYATWYVRKYLGLMNGCDRLRQTEFLDSVPCKSSPLDEQIDARELFSRVSTLPDDLRHIVMLRITGTTLIDIAAEAGLTRWTVHRHYKRALASLTTDIDPITGMLRA